MDKVVARYTTESGFKSAGVDGAMPVARLPEFRCFLDESQGKSVFTVTGAVSSRENWGRFEHSWKAALRDARLCDIVDQQRAPLLHAFHMADFESRIKPFDRWTQEQRIGLQARY